MPTPPELRRVQQAASKHEAARVQLEDAMRAASAAGHSLRAISAAAGMSPEWVRRIIAGTARKPS